MIESQTTHLPRASRSMPIVNMVVGQGAHAEHRPRHQSMARRHPEDWVDHSCINDDRQAQS